MSKTIKVARARRIRHQASRRDQADRRRGSGSLISRDLDKTKEVAAKYGIGHVTTDLADSLAIKELTR